MSSSAIMSNSELINFKKSLPQLRIGTCLRPSSVFLVVCGFFLTTWGAMSVIPDFLLVKSIPLNNLLALISWICFAALIMIVLIFRGVRIKKQIANNSKAGASYKNDSFVLYLRSFTRVDKVKVPNTLKNAVERELMGGKWDFELSLSAAISDLFDIIAIGRKGFGLGAAKLLTENSHWKNVVNDLMHRASVVYLIPFPSPGTTWEISQIIEQEDLRRKTIFFMPPSTTMEALFRKRDKKWNEVNTLLGNAILPAYDKKGMLFMLGENNSHVSFSHNNLSKLEQLSLQVAYLANNTSLSSLEIGKEIQVCSGEAIEEERKIFTAGAIWQTAKLLVFVMLLRGFLYEPFRIPSGSMAPTLIPGDFILVKKYVYSLRLGGMFLGRKNAIFETGEPKRGEIIVFQFPKSPELSYIKRVIGVPGDHIIIDEKKNLYVNGVLVERKEIPEIRLPTYITRNAEFYSENISGNGYAILLNPDGIERGHLDITVPPTKYFVLGDNRDNSNDSRFWGFVPVEYLIGEAFLIWMHHSESSFFGYRRFGSIN